MATEVKSESELKYALQDVLPLLEYLADKADPDNQCSEFGVLCGSTICNETGCISLRFHRAHQAVFKATPSPA